MNTMKGVPGVEDLPAKSFEPTEIRGIPMMVDGKPVFVNPEWEKKADEAMAKLGITELKFEPRYMTMTAEEIYKELNQKKVERTCTVCGWKGTQEECGFGHDDYYCPICLKETLNKEGNNAGE